MLMPTVSPISVGGGLSVSGSVGGGTLEGYIRDAGTATTIGTLLVSVSNGVGPYSYEIEELAGPSGISPNTPSLNNTKFSIFFAVSPTLVTGNFRYKVTDSLGAIGYTEYFLVTLQTTPGPFP